MGDYVHTLGLVVDRRVQSGLVIEANKQFKSETWHLFIPTRFEWAVFDRIIYNLFSNKHRISVDDGLAGENEFSVIEYTIHWLSQNGGYALLDFYGIMDATNDWLNPRLQVLSHRMAHVPYLILKENDCLPGISKCEIRGGDYGIQANPRSIGEVQLPLRNLGLPSGLLRQLFRMSSSQCHQATLGRGLCDQFPGLPSRRLHLCNLIAHGFVLPMHHMPLSSQFMSRAAHLPSLPFIDQPSEEHHNQLQDSHASEHPCKPRQFPLSGTVFIGCLLAECCCMVTGCCGVSLAFCHNARLRRTWRGLCGLGLISISLFGAGCALSIIGFGDPFAFWRFRWFLGEDDYCEQQPFHRDKSVTQKYLTRVYYCNTVISMANILNVDKQTAIIAALAEGSSIRSIERISGVHRDTIMRLGVRVGNGCQMLLDSKMQDLGCRYLQFDEVWGFIGKKERHVRVDDNPEYGDVWTFCAIDSETKLVPSFRCGKRNHVVANEFVKDVASRMRNQVQISTDALHGYVEAVEQAFGTEVDYGQIVKVYTHDAAQHPERKYSAPTFASAVRRPIVGNPDMDLVSTSHIERLNGTTRLHVKRLSRLTLAFSKKLDNFKAAVALHFAYYNLVKRHNTLRCTPAMAAGIERDFWTVEQLVEAVS
jgi:IS1 family transposase